MKQATKNKNIFLFDASASHAKGCHHTQMQRENSIPPTKLI
jgi:hypothetical protein